MTKEEIIKKINKSKMELSKFDVISLSLFGSYESGNPTEKSDIDFLVMFDNNTFRNFTGLKYYLENIFHKNIDLVCENSIKESMLPFINKMVLWQKN